MDTTVAWYSLSNVALPKSISRMSGSYRIFCDLVVVVREDWKASEIEQEELGTNFWRQIPRSCVGEKDVFRLEVGVDQVEGMQDC